MYYFYSPMHPLALGDDIDVPFINCFFCKVQLGTEVMAPPGAEMLTPKSPSVLQKKFCRLKHYAKNHCLAFLNLFSPFFPYF